MFSQPMVELQKSFAVGNRYLLASDGRARLVNREAVLLLDDQQIVVDLQQALVRFLPLIEGRELFSSDELMTVCGGLPYHAL